MTDIVGSDEILARYITSSRWYRKKDQTVKQDAFIPSDDPPVELSATRHFNLLETDIWRIGRIIAEKISRNLHGRADVLTVDVLNQNLGVVSAPDLPDNPNHANIVGWPSDKDARKMRAMEIARVARFVANPAIQAQVP